MVMVMVMGTVEPVGVKVIGLGMDWGLKGLAEVRHPDYLETEWSGEDGTLIH